MPSASQPAESAKQFLISKVMEQAVNDGIMLSDFEKRMLNFSEGTGSATDIEAAEQFVIPLLALEQPHQYCGFSGDCGLEGWFALGSPLGRMYARKWNTGLACGLQFRWV